MQCQTIKKDKECFFWSKSGCGQLAGHCQTVVEKCEGCAKIETMPTGSYCTSYAEPQKQWLIGNCNMATNLKAEAKEATKMVNPLKASKRAGGKR